MAKLKAFTLVEVVVSVGVFAIVIVSASSAFMLIHQSWRRNANFIDMLRDCRWATELISNDIRLAEDIVQPKTTSDKNRLDLWVDIDGDGDRDRVRYRVNGNNLERSFKLFGQSGINNAEDVDTGWNYGLLTDRLVNDKPFSLDGKKGSSVIINLVLRPTPTQPERWLNRNFTFRAIARRRN